MTTKNAKDTMYAGNRRVFHFTIKDEAGALLNLASMTATWKLSRILAGAPDGPAVLTKTSAGGDITFVTPTSTGELNLVVAEGATSALLGTYYWELELTDVSNNTNVVAYGEIEIRKNL